MNASDQKGRVAAGRRSPWGVRGPFFCGFYVVTASGALVGAVCGLLVARHVPVGSGVGDYVYFTRSLLTLTLDGALVGAVAAGVFGGIACLLLAFIYLAAKCMMAARLSNSRTGSRGDEDS